jgi:hypothetical protein
MNHTTRTQAGVRGKGLYNHLYEHVDEAGMDGMSRTEMVRESDGLGMAPGQERRARTQKGLQSQHMYDHLLQKTKPVKHPYLPYTERKQGLAGYLGQAAEKTAPGLMLALGAVIVYYLFFRKGKPAEVAEETFIEEEIEPMTSRLF